MLTSSPPEPLLVEPNLHEWEKYYHSDEPDLLVQLAVIHAQFEIIHPLIDGNGRLGRMLIPLFLFEKALLSRPVFYVSAFLDQNREAYAQKLRAIGRRRGAWNDWIEFFLTAVTRQAESNTNSARQIISLYERLKNDVIAFTNSRFAVPVLDVLFEKPMLTPTEFANRSGLPSKPMLMRLLEKLKDEKILSVVREGSGRRPQILLFNELFQIRERTVDENSA